MADRKDKEPTKPRINPKLVEMNRRHREVWDKRNREFEERIRKYPSDVTFAVDRYNEQIIKQMATGSNPGLIDPIEKHVLDLAERDRTLQKIRSRSRTSRRSERLDAIDQVIVEGIRRGKTAKDIWVSLTKAAENSDELDVDAKGETVWLRMPDGRSRRRLSVRSIGPTVTKLRKKLACEN